MAINYVLYGSNDGILGVTSSVSRAYKQACKYLGTKNVCESDGEFISSADTKKRLRNQHNASVSFYDGSSDYVNHNNFAEIRVFEVNNF
jgi:hypothetical protein